MGTEIPPLCLEKMAERGINPNTKAGKEYIFGWTKGRVNLAKVSTVSLSITNAEEKAMSGYLEDIIEKNERIEEVLAVSSLPDCGTYVLFTQKSANPWAFGTVMKDLSLGFVHSYNDVESAVENFHKMAVE